MFDPRKTLYGGLFVLLDYLRKEHGKDAYLLYIDNVILAFKPRFSLYTMYSYLAYAVPSIILYISFDLHYPKYGTEVDWGLIEKRLHRLYPGSKLPYEKADPNKLHPLDISAIPLKLRKKEYIETASIIIDHFDSFSNENKR